MAQSTGGTSRAPLSVVCKPGKKTRNPYLNFLRDFRQQNCHLSVVEVVRQGAERWRQMSDDQKLPYVKIAFYTPMKRRMCLSCKRKMLRMKRRPMKTEDAIARRKPISSIPWQSRSQTRNSYEPSGSLQ
uniref:HMG box domain-containing protein n=1 Tax=Anopheles minimus TaxID=112268 RepID=A0A182VV28_9DIPT